MLTDVELEEFFEKHKLTMAAREYINLTRESAPSRLVGTNASTNSCEWIPSVKMGWTIQSESLNGESLNITKHEFDERTFEIWDQPPPVIVTRTDKNGKPRRGTYHPDCLVLTEEGAEIEEIKADGTFQKRLEKTPNDWAKDEDGCFTYLPAKNTFADLGLPFKLKLLSDFNKILIANLNLVLESREKAITLDPVLLPKIEKYFKKHAWARLSDLLDDLAIVDNTPIHRLIDEKRLFATIETDFLTQHESILVAASPQTLAIGCDIRNKNNKHCEALTQISPPISQTVVPTEAKALKALNKIDRLESGEKSRSQRRWNTRIKEGEAKGLSIFQALLDKNGGNSKQRVNNIVENHLKKFLLDPEINALRLKPVAGYKRYEISAKDAHPNFDPVSRTTYNKRKESFCPQKQARGRGGRRAANTAANPSPVETRRIKPLAPFQVTSADHHLAKVFCILAIANGIVYSARPWLSVLYDVLTDYVLAIWLGFRQPSARTCAILLRQCVRKHGRFPSSIIVDGGPDFKCNYFMSLLADQRCKRTRRPPEDGRYGSEAERFFGEIESKLINHLPGNLVDYKNHRAVSSTHAPANNAELTITHLLKNCLDYVDIRNQSIIGTADKSPVLLMDEGLLRFPHIGKELTEDHSFIISSAVDVRDYKVDPTRGIHTDSDIHYWHPDLVHIAGKKKNTLVRMEPEDPYRIYASVNNQWITCLATGETQFITQDPLIRQAEAVRILEGKESRNQAKRYADEAHIRKLLATNSELSAHSIFNATPDPLLDQNIRIDSIFSKTATSTPTPLVTSSWED